MTQFITSNSINSNRLQELNPNGRNASVPGGTQGSSDLFAEFSLILDKIAVQLSHNQEIFNMSSDLRPADIASRKEVPQPQPEQQVDLSALDEESEELETLEEDEASEKYIQFEEGSSDSPVIDDAAPVVSEQSTSTNEVVVNTDESQEKTEELVGPSSVQAVQMAPVGEQASTGQESNDVISRLLREQLSKQQDQTQTQDQTQELRPQPVDDRSQRGAQPKAQDVILKNFLVQEGILQPDEDGSQVTKALETALRSLFSQTGTALESNVRDPNQQSKLVLSPFILRQAFEMSALGAGSDSSVSSTTSPRGIQAINSGNAGKHADLGEMGRRSERTERKETPMSQRATLRTLERVEQALKEIAKSKDGKTISLRLDPPELGNLKIDVSLRDGSLHARLVADSTQVSQLLRDKAGEIQRSLRELGLDVDQVSVSVRDEAGQFSQFFSGSEQGQNTGQGNRDSFMSGSREAAGSTNTQSQDSLAAIEDHWVA